LPCCTAAALAALSFNALRFRCMMFSFGTLGGEDPVVSRTKCADVCPPLFRLALAQSAGVKCAVPVWSICTFLLMTGGACVRACVQGVMVRPACI
jgi:hypothetical protein